MSGFPPELSEEQWQIIADEFGGGKSVLQLRDRCENYAKPDLGASQLRLVERRAVAALAVGHPGKWTWIARQLGKGHYRSAQTVRSFALSFLERLKKLEMVVECGWHIGFVPDAVFEQQKIPTGFDRQEMLARFDASKVLLADLPQSFSPGHPRANGSVSSAPSRMNDYGRSRRAIQSNYHWGTSTVLLTISDAV
jgi:hypothetical protein